MPHVRKERQARAGVKSGRMYGGVTAMEEFSKKNCIRGYRVYKEVWESLVCEREAKKCFRSIC